MCLSQNAENACEQVITGFRVTPDWSNTPYSKMAPILLYYVVYLQITIVASFKGIYYFEF